MFPDLYRVGLLALCLFLLWNIETLLALTVTGRKWRHASINARFILTGIPVQFGLGLAFTALFRWGQTHPVGLLHRLPHRPGLLTEFLLTFVLLDLGEYGYHVLMHKIKAFWRFHVVHHSDEFVDVSSVLREHPGETAIRLAFTFVWVFLLGATFWTVLLRQCIQIVSNALAHAHFQLPERMDRVVGLLFVTPNLHHVHHHDRQPYTDTNYGDVLIIWDRLFGTFGRLNASRIHFGVDTLPIAPETIRFRTLLDAPFVTPVSTLAQLKPGKLGTVSAEQTATSPHPGHAI